MKNHFVIKLRKPLPADLAIPSWLEFITDKSMTRDSLTPEVDKLLAEAGAKFWVSREYEPQSDNWNHDEIREGLNRTYRMILQQAYELPGDLVARIKLLPEVDDAHELNVGHAKMPEHRFATETSLAASTVSDMIYLAYAKSFTRGVPGLRIAVLDTGVNLDHPELQGKLMPGADFVNLEGLDTTGFIGDFLGYDTVPEDEV